jgi:hypothetical protein
VQGEIVLRGAMLRKEQFTSETIMGHIRIGTLPATRRWQDVIGLISEGAEAPRLAEAVTHAWEKAFNAVRSDAGFREAVWLLMQIGAAGKGRDPTGHLSSVGVEVVGAASVVEVAMALSAAMERRLEASRQRSDFGELAQRALISAVTEELQQSMPTLLDSTVEDVGSALSRCGKEKAFGRLAREFFARMTNECLSYFLSKTLPAQVGEGRRFATTAQLADFENAMRTHCAEAAEIVESYSSGWFSKHLWQEGKITRDSAEKFGWFGLEKMRGELAMRARENAAA